MPQPSVAETLLEKFKEVAVGPPPQPARLQRLKDVSEQVEAALRALPANDRSAARYRLAILCADEAERFAARGYAHAAEVMTRAAERLR